jgi:hypothetical protein
MKGQRTEAPSPFQSSVADLIGHRGEGLPRGMGDRIIAADQMDPSPREERRSDPTGPTCRPPATCGKAIRGTGS